MKKTFLALSVLIFSISLCRAQSNLDLAPGGTLTTNGVNFGGGANNRNFYALTNLQTGQYLTVDIGSSQTVNSIAFGCWFAGDIRYIPLNYTIDYSNDNTTWTNIVTVTGNSNLTPSNVINQSARYWRLTNTASQAGIGSASISGLQIISSGAGSLLTNNLWNSPWAATNIFTNSPVGIGTTNNPTGFMLAVNGAAIATTMTVQLYSAWPDYVFKPTYHLPSLNEIKGYIDKNQHLPGMPSATAIEKQGINLGEMNMLLTKKVEELTLYLIEKDTQLKAQEEINRKQEERLKKIEAQLSELTRAKKN